MRPSTKTTSIYLPSLFLILMGKNSIFAPFQQQYGHITRMPQSFVKSQSQELFKCCLYMLKYFIILYDKNGPGIDRHSKVS